MTLNQLSYNLLTLLSGGRSTDNDYRTLEQIKFNIFYYRALYAKRQSAKGDRMYELEQTISNIPVTNTVTFIMPNNATGVYMTTMIVPKTIKLKDLSLRETSGITEVITTMGNIPLIQYRAVGPMIASRLTGNKPKAFEVQGKLGLVNYTNAPVTISGIFEDPRAAYNMDAVINNRADLWDDDKTEFPISSDLYALITQGLMSNEVAMLTMTTSDNTANQTPDNQLQSKPRNVDISNDT